MHLSILISIFYIIQISTSLFLLTFPSLHLSMNTSNWRNSFLLGSCSTVMYSPKQELKLKLLSIIKLPKSYHTKAQHTEPISPALAVLPDIKLCYGGLGSGSLFLLCFLFKVNEHEYGISLAEAAGGTACNLQYVRLHNRCDEGQREAVVLCGARFLCFF